MSPYEIIIKKRNGKKLDSGEIRYFMGEYLQNRIPEYQMSAFLMAVYFQGMDENETQVLIETFLDSGTVIILDDIPGIKVGKHSTGGVGDKVSILVAPIVSAAGVPVPMISGRGLGHTGGTLDKLSSIPGFRADLDIQRFRQIISETGTCLIGQTAELVPLDRRIYALRDVTGTIESLPLITSSILSKKIAEGSNALVLDIKCGNGAFLQSPTEAENLAGLLLKNGKKAGIKTAAYITNMDSPLGRSVGNWLEISECIDCLHDDGAEDLMEITHQLAGTMIFLGGVADSIEQGIRISQNMIAGGKAWKKFREIIQAQNGNLKVIENPADYPASAFSCDVASESSGYVRSIAAMEVGLSLIELGGGRRRAEDEIDPRAGIILHKKPGDPVRKGEKLLTVFTDRQNVISAVTDRLKSAVFIQPSACKKPQMILKYMD